MGSLDLLGWAFVPGGPISVVVEEFNGDGNFDLAMANQDGVSICSKEPQETASEA